LKNRSVLHEQRIFSRFSVYLGFQRCSRRCLGTSNKKIIPLNVPERQRGKDTKISRYRRGENTTRNDFVKSNLANNFCYVWILKYEYLLKKHINIHIITYIELVLTLFGFTDLTMHCNRDFSVGQFQLYWIR